MNSVTIAKAIKERKPIQFTYVKPGKNPGLRYGDPHAIFVNTTKAGVRSTKVHIAQTAGVSDSGIPFPSFRMFDIDDLVVNSILSDDPVFQNHPDYNPNWEGYSEVIEQV